MKNLFIISFLFMSNFCLAQRQEISNSYHAFEISSVVITGLNISHVYPTLPDSKKAQYVIVRSFGTLMYLGIGRKLYSADKKAAFIYQVLGNSFLAMAANNDYRRASVIIRL